MIKSVDKMKKLLTILMLLVFSQQSFSQHITLEESIELARQNYPGIQQKGLIQKSVNYSLENASKAFLPQLAFNGQATYQSDVTRIPIVFPGVKEMSKDQYRVQGELTQLLYDGGVIKNQKALLKANEAVQLQNVEISLNTLKERIAQLYFSILLFDAQLKQRSLYRENLVSALKKAEENVKEGTATKSSVNELKAEIINADMTDTEIRFDYKAYKEMLGLLIGKPLGDHTEFLMPQQAPIISGIKRPELKLFELQKKSIDVQAKKLQSDWMPRVSAFIQGGYGRPGLNMLDPDFAPFAIGGLRFNLPLSNLYNYKTNMSIMEINRRQIDVDRQTFILNTNASLQKEKSDILKYLELMQQDDELIALREEITRSAQAQLNNGVITTNEYINKLNTENLARQMKNLHRIQLLKAQTTYKIIAGY